jgi:histidine ammonia-lyase
MTLDAIPRLERIVGYELLCACQAIDCDPGPPGRVVGALHAAVRERVAPLVEDRPPADDLAALLDLVTGGGAAGLLATADGSRLHPAGERTP